MPDAAGPDDARVVVRMGPLAHHVDLDGVVDRVRRGWRGTSRHRHGDRNRSRSEHRAGERRGNASSIARRILLQRTTETNGDLPTSHSVSWGPVFARTRSREIAQRAAPDPTTRHLSLSSRVRRAAQRAFKVARCDRVARGGRTFEQIRTRHCDSRPCGMTGAMLAAQRRQLILHAVRRGRPPAWSSWRSASACRR